MRWSHDRRGLRLWLTRVMRRPVAAREEGPGLKPVLNLGRLFVGLKPHANPKHGSEQFSASSYAGRGGFGFHSDNFLEG
jgi:hypothetical protein